MPPGAGAEGKTFVASREIAQDHVKIHNSSASVIDLPEEITAYDAAVHPEGTSAYDSASRRSHAHYVQAEKVISCTLSWTECCTVDRYHIFYHSRKGDLPDESARRIYLGSTALGMFRAMDMRLLGKHDCICIEVSATSARYYWDINKRTSVTIYVDT